MCGLGFWNVNFMTRVNWLVTRTRLSWLGLDSHDSGLTRHWGVGLEVWSLSRIQSCRLVNYQLVNTTMRASQFFKQNLITLGPISITVSGKTVALYFNRYLNYFRIVHVWLQYRVQLLTSHICCYLWFRFYRKRFYRSWAWDVVWKWIVHVCLNTWTVTSVYENYCIYIDIII